HDRPDHHGGLGRGTEPTLELDPTLGVALLARLRLALLLASKDLGLPLLLAEQRGLGLGFGLRAVRPGPSPRLLLGGDSLDVFQLAATATGPGLNRSLLDGNLPLRHRNHLNRNRRPGVRPAEKPI